MQRVIVCDEGVGGGDQPTFMTDHVHVYVGGVRGVTWGRGRDGPLQRRVWSARPARSVSA